VDKKEVMNEFERIVTDPRIRLSDVTRHMETLEDDECFMDEYRVLTTAGSTGRKGVFLYDREAWTCLMAGVERGAGLIGVGVRPERTASIGSGSPLHLSYRRAVSEPGDYGTKKLMLKVTDPLERLTEELNKFQPRILHTYPSLAGLLAEEQINGRLAIHPEVIVTGAEILAGETARKIRDVWGGVLFNSYSCTEGILGVECGCHKGIHIFEDLCIVEVVDEQQNPVPDGRPGRRILMTNLYQKTMPLIRYAISDMVTLSADPCPCGRPFRMITEVHGRVEEVIYLDGIRNGKIPVWPAHLNSLIMPRQEVLEYQVAFRQGRLDMAVVAVPGVNRKDTAALLSRIVGEGVESLGAKRPPIRVRFLDRIERHAGKMGKKPIVVLDFTDSGPRKGAG
jgi:phenylacetate-coenzyme A ligase PaaK-like adenylate-forming protein